MHRFFFDPEKRRGETVFLSTDESYHLQKVLRLEVGSRVELLDGIGTVFVGIVVADGRHVEVEIERVLRMDEEPQRKIWLAQAVLKGEKMDTVVQKCTELGVVRIQPFYSSRCQGKPKAAQGIKKQGRWQRICLSSCKQCGRSRPPVIAPPVSFGDCLRDFSGVDNMIKLLFWEEEKEVGLHDISIVDDSRSAFLMLGPEGGFSAEEAEQARRQGWISVGLGERVLRAETATITSISIVQYLFGNI